MTTEQRQDMENRIDEAMAKFIKDFCAEDSSLIACAESAFYSAKKAVLAAPQPATEQDEMARFEAWYRKEYTSYPPALERRDGEYCNLDTQLAWRSWQAAIESAVRGEK